MHKGVVLLTKAKNRRVLLQDEALEKTEAFLIEYAHSVWGHYIIGGRCHNLLAPKDKLKIFNDWVKKEYKDIIKSNLYTPSDLCDNKIQEKWEEIGLTGTNPYYDYPLNEDTKDDYNIVRLNTCIETVKERLLDLPAKAEEAWNLMLKAKRIEEGRAYQGWSGRYARQYHLFYDKKFSEYSSVFDIHKYKAEELPHDDEINEYWAIMVDMYT